MSEKRFFRDRVLKPTIALGMAGVALASCSNEQNNKGDIFAGTPAKVVKHWSRTDTSAQVAISVFGYNVFLQTEDCPEGVQPAPGAAVEASCKVKTHQADANTFLNYPEGSFLVWPGSKGTSEVQSRLASDYSARSLTTLTTFSLEVEQCRPEKECVDDFVTVDPWTWVNSPDGSQITFAGDTGHKVSR